MYTLIVDTDAENDLGALKRANKKAWALVVAFIEQAKADQDLLDRLSQDHYHDDDYNIRRWIQEWRNGLNLFRLRILALDDLGVAYRIIYAFDPCPRPQCYYVLGVIPRSFGYDPNDHRTKRIRDAYERLGITRF
ncbi:MAG: hypothetical protein ACYDEV_10025 [Acidiferrobacter sp.]